MRRGPREEDADAVGEFVAVLSENLRRAGKGQRSSSAEWERRRASQSLLERRKRQQDKRRRGEERRRPLRGNSPRSKGKKQEGDAQPEVVLTLKFKLFLPTRSVLQAAEVSPQ